ncbi:MFS transporter [Roseomonas sp. NAR14]|uniref:MFS transporter n=1 Tax=Roseomonas acroporae TaxID=2937791 RepID=A0A9X2BU84_9PROT|nr:MFS transporter [Roseomonas acroporae]MCK8783791.1 MFS transporter [Roseomonas acroporae]
MPPPRDPRLIAAIVASALFMQNLDSTVIATALPAMAADFGVPVPRMSVAITAYLVALTVFIPVSGWVADRFGARRVFLAAILVFTAASALCGRAEGLGALVAARVLQGMGGAMMVPVGRLLLLRQVRRDQLLTATTWLTMPALLGPIMGPPLGGFLTDALSWRAVFDINVPVGLLGMGLVWRFIPDLPAGDPGRLDLTGLALTGIALASLMLGIETIGRGVLPHPLPEAAMALGLGLGWLGVRHCLSVPSPAIDFTLLRIPSFNVPALAGSLFRVGAGAVPFLVPLTLQMAFGRSAAQSGLISFASALGALLMKPVVRPMLARFGFRRALVGNGVVAALSVAVCALFDASWPAAALFGVLLAAGLSRSLQFTALNTLCYADVPQNKLSAATSLYGTLQQLSLAAGVAVAAASLEVLTALAGRAEPVRADFAGAFLVAGLAVLLAVPLYARLPADAGEGAWEQRRAKARG